MERRVKTSKEMKSLRIELSLEDYDLLNDKCKERGTNRSTYIRELIRGTNKNMYYSLPVKNALENISDGCLMLKEENLSSNGQKALEKIEGGIKILWQYSR